MGLSAPALTETRVAFDRVAPTYGRDNDRNPVITWMRARAIDWVTDQLPGSARILDLGCGPGPDTVHLARRGFVVTGLEWSPGMATQAVRHIDASRVRHRARVYNVGIHEVHRWPEGRFDVALSNLGALNCVPDLPQVAAALAQRIPRGGRVVLSVIGRVCPWEWFVHGLRGEWSRVAVRFRPDFVPVPLDGQVVWTRYLTARDLRAAFHPAGFRQSRVRALGLAVPPPYLEAFCQRHPTLWQRLQRIDDAIGAWPVIRGCGDHVLIEFVRT